MAEGTLFVGNVEVLALTDGAGEFPFTLRQLFPAVPAEAWVPFQQRYPTLFPGPDTWHNHYGCYVLRSQGRTILVDTGIGSHATNPGMITTLAGGVDGRLLTELQAAGVRPDDVHTVFLTHLHPDHVGWNLWRDGVTPRATFPNARYVMHQADWEAFQRPEVQGAMPFAYWEETLGPLATLGVLELITGEQALTGEITAIPTPGHTPGHMSLAIVSGGQRALIMGDVAIHPAQVTETDWAAIFDMDPQLAAQVRRQVFDRVEAEDSTLVACHFPAPGFGRLVRLEGSRYWQGF
jgi:glyoxylase-like metal-dependent hydrolase (beta-lactamase superfamily II)